MTMAVMLISLSVARQRGEPRRNDAESGMQRIPTAPAVNLDALRSAGL